MRCFERNVPAIFIGSPGVGKSGMPRELASDLGIGFVDKRLSLCESVDLRGNPVADHAAAYDPLVRPGRYALRGQRIEVPGEGDSRARRDQRLQPVQCRSRPTSSPTSRCAAVASTCSMPGWYVCATGNKVTDGAGAKRLNSALANRFAWIDVEVDVTAWCHWAMTNGVPMDLVAYHHLEGREGRLRAVQHAEGRA